MEYDTFKNRYDRLNALHKNIAYHTMRRLEHENKHKGIKPFKIDIRKGITAKRKEKGIGYEELYDLAIKAYEGKKMITYEAYQKMISHNRIKSKLFKPVLKVLGVVKPHDVMEFSKEYYENLIIMESDSMDLEWLYNTLSDVNKKVMIYLVNALYMAEVTPEVLEKGNNYYE